VRSAATPAADRTAPAGCVCRIHGSRARHFFSFTSFRIIACIVFAAATFRLDEDGFIMVPSAPGLGIPLEHLEQ
jgi:hypothetical protein